MTVANLTLTANNQTVRFGLNEDATYTRSAASSGGGGWQIVDRPRSQVSTEWTDLGQFVLTLNLIMDSMIGQQPASIEGDIATVESWELPAPGSSPPQPPTVRVAGPVAHTELDWIIYTLNWGTAIRFRVGPERCYQELQLVLWQYLPPKVATGAVSPAQAAQNAAGGGQAVAGYTVRSGDTLSSIAAAQLGSWTAWSKIAALNGIRDPNTIVPNQRLVLPGK